MKRTILAVFSLLALLVASTALAETRAERADLIRKKASVTYSGQYEVDVPIAKVRAALQRPLLMGTLWDSYQYGPGYKVTALAEPRAVHVVDPSGIVGDVWPVSSTTDRIVYLAQGNLKHWAVPVMNKGTAVFDVGLAPKGTGTRVSVSVFVKPENPIASTALWVMTPVAKSRIENRVTNNFRDATNILKDMASAPEAVAARLQGPVRQEFENSFVPRPAAVAPAPARKAAAGVTKAPARKAATTR